MVDIVRRKQDPDHQRRELTSSADIDAGTTLEEDMKYFLLNKTGREFSDVDLILDDDSIPSHKAVLAARSSYFEAMFRSFSPPDNKVPIAIGEMIPSKQSFESLLKYIYYGNVEMSPEDSLYLFSAPFFYIFSNNRLQVFCKYNLERNVTVENVVQILEVAHQSHFKDMKKYTSSVIVKHFHEVAQLPSIQHLSKELLLDIIQSLASDYSDRKMVHDMAFASITSD
jgi:hypothetical protein